MAATFVHQAFLYEDQDDYAQTIRQFTLEGLDAGNAALIAVPGANLRLLRRALQGRADDVVFADMAQVGRNPVRIIPFIADFLSRQRDRCVRFVGEPIWHGRPAAETVEGVRHEALLNVAFANAAAMILCPYDAARLDADVLADARRTHPELRCGGATLPSDAYRDPLEVYGARDRPLPPVAGFVATVPVSGDFRSLRDWVTTEARALSLSSCKVADLALATHEAVANTFVHAGGRGWARIWRGDGEVICEIADCGTIRDPLAGRRDPGADRAGGRGLWMINHLCDLVELRSGVDGTVLRLHMTLG